MIISEWPAEKQIRLLQFRGKKTKKKKETRNIIAASSSETMSINDDDVHQTMELFNTVYETYELLQTLTDKLRKYETFIKKHPIERIYHQLEPRLKSIEEDIKSFNTTINSVEQQIGLAVAESEIHKAKTDMNVPGEEKTENTLRQLVEKGKKLVTIQYRIYLQKVVELQRIEKPEVVQKEKPVTSHEDKDSISVEEQLMMLKVQEGKMFDENRDRLRKMHGDSA